MLKTFYSERSNGPMSGGKAYYDPSMSREEIIKDLRERRQKLGELKGFSGKRILVPLQDVKLEKYSNGHCEDVTERMQDTLNENPDYDLWNFDIPCDVMYINSSLKGVALAYPVADCPVVIASTRKAMALGHCSVVHIDRMLPKYIVEALRSKTNCADGAINVYVGPCAGDSYVYETYPNWAKDPIWEQFVTDTGNGFRIDLKGAIRKELDDINVSNVTMSSLDTITDPRFYSNYAFNHGDPTKNGRFLTGAYFDDRNSPYTGFGNSITKR